MRRTATTIRAQYKRSAVNESEKDGNGSTESLKINSLNVESGLKFLAVLVLRSVTF